MGGLDKQHDDGQGHMREAAEHGSAADHGVDPRVRRPQDAEELGQRLADGPSHQSASEHGRDERTHWNWEAWHPRGQRQVRGDGQEQGVEVELLDASGVEVLHRTLGTREEERRSLAVVALRARVAHVGQALAEPPVVLGCRGVVVGGGGGVGLLQAWQQRGQQDEDERAERRVGNDVSDLRPGLPLVQPALALLAPRPTEDVGARQEGAAKTAEGGDEEEEGDVDPVPGLETLEGAFIEQQSVHVSTDHVQQPSGDEHGDARAEEGANSELQGPGGDGDLFDHVENRPDGRPESRGDACGPAQHAADALGVSKPFLFEEELQGAATFSG
mmetsp:Transcript_9386/g.25517  ORF Transcript_9386/g.25517 Transcript_9386/m.25517 type:complete len:330 (-) Transcript_9386:422-1411(-)